MELSKETLQGLVNIQNINILPEETFLQVVETVISHICQRNTDTRSIASVYGSKPDIVKKAFVDISCLFIEAARHDFNADNVETFLKNEHIIGQRVEKLRDTYISNKREIQAQLELTGNSLPHIIDTDWHLDYCVKSDTHNFMGMPIYHVRLTTKKHGEVKYVTFACSMQQLQELVYKLKDAVRHIEKIANV